MTHFKANATTHLPKLCAEKQSSQHRWTKPMLRLRDEASPHHSLLPMRFVYAHANIQQGLKWELDQLWAVLTINDHSLLWGPSARPYVSHPRAHALNKGRGSGAVCELDTSETQRSPAVAVGDFFRQPPCSVLRTFSWPSLQYAVLWQEGCNSLRLQLSTLAVSSNTA